jgi:hypothetical protein
MRPPSRASRGFGSASEGIDSSSTPRRATPIAECAGEPRGWTLGGARTRRVGARPKRGGEAVQEDGQPVRAGREAVRGRHEPVRAGREVRARHEPVQEGGEPVQSRGAPRDSTGAQVRGAASDRHRSEQRAASRATGDGRARAGRRTNRRFLPSSFRAPPDRHLPLARRRAARDRCRSATSFGGTAGRVPARSRRSVCAPGSRPSGTVDIDSATTSPSTFTRTLPRSVVHAPERLRVPGLHRGRVPAPGMLPGLRVQRALRCQRRLRVDGRRAGSLHLKPSGSAFRTGRRARRSGRRGRCRCCRCFLARR